MSSATTAAASMSSSPSSSSSVSARSPLFIPFDPSSPIFVAKSVLASGTVGAITGASIGVVQSKNPFALSINMTINLSIAGLAFFGIREYLVSPILLATEATHSHARRLAQLQLSDKARGKLPELDYSLAERDAPRSIGEVRMDRMIDSALAGALAGGGLSTAFRGRATLVRAAITSALIASGIQLSANQLRVIRLQILAKRAEAISTPAMPVTPSSAAVTVAETLSSPPVPTAKPPPSASAAPAASAAPMQASFDTPLKLSEADQRKAIGTTLPERMMSGLSSFLPVRKLSDEEYLSTLQRKRESIDKRLREIEDEERRMWDWAQAQERKTAQS